MIDAAAHLYEMGAARLLRDRAGTIWAAHEGRPGARPLAVPLGKLVFTMVPLEGKPHRSASNATRSAGATSEVPTTTSAVRPEVTAARSDAARSMPTARR